MSISVVKEGEDVEQDASAVLVVVEEEDKQDMTTTVDSNSLNDNVNVPSENIDITTPEFIKLNAVII